MILTIANSGSFGVTQRLNWDTPKGVFRISIGRGLGFRILRAGAISVVSSANREAIIEEWTASGLLNQVSYLFSQSDGSKSDCIKEMIRKGYEQHHILMVGDAPGDYAAAAANHVWYYPNLAGSETFSWERLKGYFDLLVNEGFSVELQTRLTLEMKENLEAPCNQNR